MWSIDSMSRAPRWPSPVLLLKGRMNFLTKRDATGAAVEFEGRKLRSGTIW
jgi:hypothetical protein